jgi:hypothetical protein
MIEETVNHVRVCVIQVPVHKNMIKPFRISEESLNVMKMKDIRKFKNYDIQS